MNGTCRSGGLVAACVSLLALTWVEPGVAQEDFRHLDEGRPLQVEDAYPIKFREWEWELGARAGGLEGGFFEGAGAIELKTGLFRNAQLGVEAHGVVQRVDGVSSSGLEELAVHGLYNLNQEGRRFPALAVRADLAVPGGGELSGSDPAGRAKVMMTRTLGSVRVHANGAHRWASVADGGDAWEWGLAIDHVLGLSSRLIAADVFAESPTSGGPTRVWVDVGMRLQLSKQAVVDFGVRSRLEGWSSAAPDLGFTVGISRTFGFRALTPVPRYPNPRIR